MPHTYPALFYTSHTPIQVGQRDCAMARFLGYHAGAHGTGYRRISTAIPLATGSAVHDGLQLLGDWMLDWQRVNASRRLTTMQDSVVAWAAGEAAVRYEQKARAKGLLLTKTDTDAAAANEQLILEQRTLIEALIWLYAIVRLPVMLAEYRLLAVEHEETPVLDCTCGLGDWVGEAVTHAARGCTGIVAQGRADYLWESMVDGTIAYEEFKTKASPRKSWEDAWEHAGQLFLNMEAASRRIGRDVSQAFVPVLYKGWRGRDKGKPITEPKYQHTPLVYGWYDAGNLPMREANWSARYEWYDDHGQKHRLGGTYKRTPIWLADLPLTATVNEATGTVIRPDATRVERWIKGYLVPAQYPDFVTVLGPFPRPRSRVPWADAAVRAEERLWRERLDVLRAAGAVTPEHPLVSEIIPRSWNCTRYDDTPCEFKLVCDQQPGWDAIETMGRYDKRVPHHLPEKQAFEACGVVFPAEDASDEEGAADE